MVGIKIQMRERSNLGNCTRFHTPPAHPLIPYLLYNIEFIIERTCAVFLLVISIIQNIMILNCIANNWLELIMSHPLTNDFDLRKKIDTLIHHPWIVVAATR